MLKVWLPLNGDLRNQGLADVTITNNGATVNNAGKIGKCYTFDGSDDYISLDSPELYDIIKGGSQPFTIAFWIYHADATRAILFGDYGLSGTIQFNIELNASHSIRFYWAASPDFSATNTFAALNTWTHIAIAYDGSKIDFYTNGELTFTRSGVLAEKNKTSGMYYLGRDSRTGTTAFNGRLNDVRIYDEAISPKLAKELSKGLVLHYPLNRGGFGGDNLLKNTNVFTNWWWKKHTKWSATNGMLKALNTGSTSNQFLEVWSGIGTKADLENKTIAISFDIMSPSWSDVKDANNYTELSAIGVQICSSATAPSATGNGGSLLNYTFSRIGDNTKGNWTIPDNISDNVWLHCEDVLTLDTSTWQTYGSGTVGNYFYLAFQLRMNGEIYIKNVKVELGDHATPWVPNSADALYSDMGLDNGIEYDVSGYGHNGTKTGTITYDVNTPRYWTSSKFNLGDISTDPLPSSVITISFWYKPLSGSSYIVFADTGTGLCFGREGDHINTGISGSARADTISSSGFANNSWYHIVIVKKTNTGRDVYVNGQKVDIVGNNYYTNDITGLFIGRRKTNNTSLSPYYLNGNIVDFRAYVTALSADDILTLYNAPTSIANNGTLMTQGEISEV